MPDAKTPQRAKTSKYKPGSVKIGAWNVKIRDVPRGRHSNLYGAFCEHNRTIYINRKTDAFTQASSLVHETLHCIAAQYGFEIEEEKVRILENALVSFIVDNPTVIATLIKERSR